MKTVFEQEFSVLGVTCKIQDVLGFSVHEFKEITLFLPPVASSPTCQGRGCTQSFPENDAAAYSLQQRHLAYSGEGPDV